MTTPAIYLDNHATTRVDPRVVEAMLPCFDVTYGNSGSTSHVYGWDAKAVVDEARATIASAIHASPREIVFTSGATESNNLALKGAAERHRRRGNHLVSLTTEHKSVLDPLARLERRGYHVTLVPVRPRGSETAGIVDVQRMVDALREDTILVSVMLANNEIGAIQPLADIGAICHARGILLHSDATQAVGKLPVEVEQLQVDLMSFSAHKIYGPKGCGALYVRRRNPQVRLEPLLDGGGQENGLRSGTLNVPGIVGFARAVALCHDEIPAEAARLSQLRHQLWHGLQSRVPDLELNGPAFHPPHLRLPGNLNCSFAYVDGEALMMSMRGVAVSSGSACTSANPEPSHVLRALGLNDDLTRASLRFGLGRFNTPVEIDAAVDAIADTVRRLRAMSSMA
ncbi:MAG: cysteine desulfurase family protein [Pirellulaceae bacterium]